jgi:acyl-CoA reductase-like NAD-dependent aldehyde dehydrogenase
MEKIQNYINGELVSPVSGKYIDNYNPAEGKVYSLIPDSDGADVQAAAEAAQQAFASWSTMVVEKRSAILMKVADLIDRDLDKLALAESVDNGKPVKLAKAVDIPRASSNMRFFATGAMHLRAKRTSPIKKLSIILHEHRLELLDVFRRGIFLCTYSPGKLHLLWLRAARSLPNHPSLHP